MESDCIVVYGNHGELSVVRKSGFVKEYVPNSSEGCPCNDNCYGDIKWFNVEEWLDYYGYKEFPFDSVDILDIGYRLKNGKYEPPEDDWRMEIQRMLKEEGKGLELSIVFAEGAD